MFSKKNLDGNREYKLDIDDEIDIDKLVDNLLIKKTKNYEVFSTKKHYFLKNTKDFFRKKTTKRILAGFILMILIFAFWASSLPQFYGDFGLDIIVTLEPRAVYNGETIHINVSIPDYYNITSLTADMDEKQIIDLDLINNKTEYHIWSGSWVVNDMAPGLYMANIIGLNSENISYSNSIEWKVLTKDENNLNNSYNESDIPYNDLNNSTYETVTPIDNVSNNNTNDYINTLDENLNESEGSFNNRSGSPVIGLNATLWSNKNIYFINETVVIEGIVSYHNLLIDVPISVVVVGPSYNLSETLDITLGNFIYSFVPTIIGSYIFQATISYENESIFNDVRFDVVDIPIENVSLNISSLYIWDDTDYINCFVGDQINFFANYSCNNLNIVNASCLISFDINGVWSNPAIMNYVKGLYVYNRSFEFDGSFNYKVTCYADSYEKQVAINEFSISEIISNISIIDSKVNERIYVVPGTSFYVERTVSGLNDTKAIFAPLFSDSLTIEKIEIIDNLTFEGNNIVKDTLRSKEYKLGNGVSKYEKKLDKIREKLSNNMKELDNAALSDLIVLNEPIQIRIWFTAPSWDEIKSGIKDPSGKISYIVYSEYSEDYDFEGSTWWDSGWINRKLITVNCSQVYDILTNFPILINTTDIDLANDAQDDGDDIAFVLYSDNTTKLNHEIELFNGTSGDFIAWVNITSINSIQNTKIWMYYGNPLCVNQQNPTGVWDSNFIAVWHLNETSGTVYDSTSNNYDSSAVVGVNQNAIGMVNGGDSFDGSTDYIDITMTLPSTVTISAWTTYTGTSDMLWCIDSDNQGPDLFFYSGSICLNTWDGAGNPFCSIPADVNQWYLYTTVIQSGNTNLYLNDQLGGTANYRNPSGSDFHISSSAGYDWQGLIDEVRISNIARNSSWIKTSYNTIKNSSIFLSFGSEELAVPVLSNPVPSDGATYVLVPPSSFNITISDPNLDNMNITWRTNESGTWETFNVTDGGGSGVLDGTYQATNTSWVSSYLTQYWWSVNVTDGTFWSNATYNFTTKQENYAPAINSIYPSNSSTGIDLQVTCSIQVNDFEEDTMTVYWYNSSDGVIYNYQQTNSSVNSGETLYWNYTQANSFLTTYYWKVAVNDTIDNTTEWYNFITRSSDYTKPSSNITTISPYWYNSNSNPLTITCTDAEDNTGGDGLKNVTLCYYNSTDNITWSGPWNFGVDIDPWVQCSWSFTFPNSTGNYRFYSIAADNASPANIEDPPIINDTDCGYDVEPPSSSVDAIVPYDVTSSLFTINATASDSHTNVKNVTLWYRYSTVNSSWWNESWLKRKPIYFNVSSGSTSPNHQVLLNITYSSGMNSNFSDIRFVNYSNNSKELDYWIESKSDGNWVNIWLEIDSQINTTNQTLVWMYYGNQGASSNSNGTNTFVFFDDFDSFNSSKWTATGSYSLSNSQITITSGSVYTDNTVTSQPNVLCEGKVKWNNFAGYSGLEIADAQSTSGSNGGRNKLAYLMTSSGGSSSVTAWAADGTTSSYNIVGGAAQFSATAEITYIIGHAVTTSNVIFYRDRAITNSYGGTWSNSFYLWLGYFTGSASGTTDISDIVVDWVLVRNYFSSTTTYYIGNETWVCWSNASNPDLSSPWSWNFDFPDGPGYYDFISIANDTLDNKEDTPDMADSNCYYNPDTTVNINPDQWNIGTTTIGNYNYSTSGFYFNLTNNGTVSLDIQIKGSNATNATTGAQWNLSSTIGFNNYSLKYNKSLAGLWANINQTYDTFVNNLAIGSWQTFDLNIFMATTSTKNDSLSVTVTFRSVIS